MDKLYSYDYQFRLIVVGDSTVGKVDFKNDRKISFLLHCCSLSFQSSLLRTFCDGVFSQNPVSSHEFL